jgi:prepilin-type N-terminal cleavage/methylation domain-containing protein
MLLFKKIKFNFKKYQAFTLLEISVVILIIGILIAGTSQVIEMLSEASLKSVRNLSKSSRVTRTNDLSLWLDATSQKAFDKEEKDDNSTISIWKDTNPKSTSPTSSSTSSASLYPSYILSAISSLPAVRFKKTSSSVGNCVTIPSQSFENNSEDFTLYLTYSPATLDDGVIIEKNNATATTFPFSLELNAGFYKFSVKDSSNTISVIGSKQAKINTPNLIRLSRTKGSQIEISINGVSSTQSDTLTFSTFNDAELAIGCRNGATPANFITGDVGETSFFNRNLSVKEKTEIEEYLYKKWKMKKYEGALASQEYLPCAVTSGINADPTITTVSPTKIAKDIGCNTGFVGSISYKCDGGTFSVLSNSCAKTSCNLPTTFVAKNYFFKSGSCPSSNNSVTIPAAINNIALNTSTTYNFTDSNSSTNTIKYICDANGNISVEIKYGCNADFCSTGNMRTYPNECQCGRCCVNGAMWFNSSLNWSLCAVKWNI